MLSPGVRDLARPHLIPEMTGGEAGEVRGLLKCDGVVARSGERLFQLYRGAFPQASNIIAATPVTELLGALAPCQWEVVVSRAHILEVQVGVVTEHATRGGERPKSCKCLSQQDDVRTFAQCRGLMFRARRE